MSDLVTYAVDGAVGTISMDDGKVNVFSIPMLTALHAAFDEAERDGVVVLLTGRENYFSAGFDLKVFSSSPSQTVELLTLGATLTERIMTFPTPVVVACTGHAYPAGAFLLMAADLRIGADGQFRIGMNEVKIGLTVPWFAIEIARHRLHPSHFDRTVVNATMYSPQEAVIAGFLDRVVPASELAEASRAGALELAELDFPAHAATKLRVRANGIGALRGAIEREPHEPQVIDPVELQAKGPGRRFPTNLELTRRNLPLRNDNRDMGAPAVSGDGDARFLALYDQTLPAVYGYLLSRCGRVALAEDLTTETFLAAVDAVRRPDAPSVSGAWLIGVARHKLADHWRREAREERGLRAVADDDPGTEDPWEVRIDALRSKRILEGLSPHHRAALTLRYLDDLSVQEVSFLLDRSVHATEGLLVRARGAFRRAYEDEERADA